MLAVEEAEVEVEVDVDVDADVEVALCCVAQKSNSSAGQLQLPLQRTVVLIAPSHFGGICAAAKVPWDAKAERGKGKGKERQRQRKHGEPNRAEQSRAPESKSWKVPGWMAF